MHINPGESQTVPFQLTGRDLNMVTEAGKPIIAAGEYKLFIGGGQPGPDIAGVSGKFAVEGTKELPE